MAFLRVKAILQEKSETHHVFREAAVLNEVKKIWTSSIPSLFPRPLQKHLKRSVGIESFRKGVLEIRVKDSSTATLIVLKKEKILEVFQKKYSKAGIDKITVRHY